MKEVKEAFASSLPVNHPLILMATHNLGWVYREQGKYDQAEAEFVTAMEGRKIRLGPDSVDLAGTLADVALTNLRQKKYALAELRMNECVRILKKVSPNTWDLFAAYSQLGGSLLGQEKYAEAEPLLLEGYEGMVKRKISIPADETERLTETVARLVELYTRLKKAPEVAKWQAVLNTYPTRIERGPIPCGND